MWDVHTEPEKVFVRGLVNLVPAAYLLCLNLPAAFSQPCTRTFFGLYIGLPNNFTLDPHGSWRQRGNWVTESNSVLLYNGRTDKMWVFYGYKINIFSVSCQQAAHLLPTSTSYRYFPHLWMWEPSWGFVDRSWLSWGQCVGMMLSWKNVERMLKWVDLPKN